MLCSMFRQGLAQGSCTRLVGKLANPHVQHVLDGTLLCLQQGIARFRPLVFVIVENLTCRDTRAHIAD